MFTFLPAGIRKKNLNIQTMFMINGKFMRNPIEIVEN